MSHTTKDKKRLLSRIRRIKGQTEAIERALDGEGECEEIFAARRVLPGSTQWAHGRAD